MFEWLNRTVGLWPTFFVNAAVDYVVGGYIRPMIGGGPYVGGIADGIGFAAKTAAAQTSYFQSGGMGNIPLVGGLMNGNIGSSTPLGVRK